MSAPKPRRKRFVRRDEEAVIAARDRQVEITERRRAMASERERVAAQIVEIEFSGKKRKAINAVRLASLRAEYERLA